MYDFLEGHKVEIFYSPIFEDGKGNVNKMYTWFSGGSFRQFNKNNRLPLLTMYYRYPEDMLVFNFILNKPILFIVKEGKFVREAFIEDFKEDEILDNVFDYFGNKLNVRNVKELNIMKDEFDKIINGLNCKKDEEILRKLMGLFNLYINKGSVDFVKNDIKMLIDEFVSEGFYEEFIHGDLLKEFYPKWYVEDVYRNEKDFGELLHLYFSYKESIDSMDLNDKMKDWVILKYKCLMKYRDFLFKKDPLILKKYLKWIEINNINVDMPKEFINL